MKENGFVTETGFGELAISGDEAYGFRPFQLMAASIAGCSAGVLRKVLEKMRLSVSDIHVSVDVARNEAEANRIEKIHLHFVVKGEQLKQEKVVKAMEVAKKNCAMVQSVSGRIVVTETCEVVSA
uniref:OsmC family protein n=1 Tax=Numidum massiliense TaxID=1522315 RepID=UPI0036F2BBDD